MCPIKAILYCCQPGEAKDRRGPPFALFLFWSCPVRKRKKKGISLFQEWQKSHSPPSCSFYSLFGGSLFLPPPKKKKEQIPNRLPCWVKHLPIFAHSLRVSPLPRQTVVEILLGLKKKNQASNPLPSVHSSHPFFPLCSLPIW